LFTGPALTYGRDAEGRDSVFSSELEREMERPVVLVVEDEPIVAMHIARIAIEFGCELGGIAAAGPEALAIADSRPPKIALIDIRLIGRMDGIEVARRLHKQHGTLAVFITADAPHLDQRSFDFPFVAIVGKPFSHDTLEGALAEACAAASPA
jgi:two-component system, response regulator PdtaR